MQIYTIYFAGINHLDKEYCETPLLFDLWPYCSILVSKAWKQGAGKGKLVND